VSTLVSPLFLLSATAAIIADSLSSIAIVMGWITSAYFASGVISVVKMAILVYSFPVGKFSVTFTCTSSP
jgi:peptidoglycan biosynthesis protein MviN/MurJ (putative lipid II flippase)